MRRTSIALLGLLLILPAAASATHFVETMIVANCSGYETSFDVQYRPDLLEVNFDFVATIVDENDTELFRYEFSDVLVRTGGVVQSYGFAANWNDVTDETIPLFGLMTIKVVMELSYPDSPYRTNEVFENVLECAVVDSEGMSWSALKADFR